MSAYAGHELTCRFTPCSLTFPKNHRRKTRPLNIRTRRNSDPQFVGVPEINTQIKQRSSVCEFFRDQYTTNMIFSSWVIPEINTQQTTILISWVSPRSIHNETMILSLWVSLRSKIINSSWVIPVINDY
ncbi:hypothetical protein AHAS_Ahas13G0259100 [Arachis hypogaea]